MITPGRSVSGRDVARHYDVLDELYRDVWGEHVHHGLFRSRRDRPEQAVVQLIDYLAAHLDLNPGATVCDVGCGYGATTHYLAERLELDVAGITLSERQYQHAISREASRRGRVRFHCGDWLRNPYRDSEFDAVIAIESLGHMAHKPGFFREVQRVLRPGGRVGVCAWLAAPGVTPRQRENLLEPICREGALPSLGTMEEYVFMMRRAGLEPLLMEDLTREVRRTWVIVARRVAARIASRRSYQRLLANRDFEGRVFVLTVMRILAAFYSGALRYGMLVAARPAVGTAA